MEDHPVDTSELSTCSCGHNKNHPMVKGEGEYKGIGWVLNMFGISYVPVRVRYRCLKCQERFDETTDPVELKNFL